MRPFTLRPLTLGVLIVVGGMLAALPFRRYRPVGPLASSPGQADGPTASSLTAAPIEAWSPAPRPLDSPAANPAPRPAEPRWPAVQPHRRLHAPLTYEDLAVPIGRPHNAPLSQSSPGPRAATVSHRGGQSSAVAGTAVGGEAVSERESPASVPPAYERPSAALPPEGDLQPLELSESSEEAIAPAHPAGSHSVLVPTPPAEDAANPPATRLAGRRGGENRSRRLAESVSAPPDAPPETPQVETAPQARRGALASSRVVPGPSAEQPQRPVKRKRYWIHQPR